MLIKRKRTRQHGWKPQKENVQQWKWWATKEAAEKKSYLIWALRQQWQNKNYAISGSRSTFDFEPRMCTECLRHSHMENVIHTILSLTNGGNHAKPRTILYWRLTTTMVALGREKLKHLERVEMKFFCGCCVWGFHLEFTWLLRYRLLVELYQLFIAAWTSKPQQSINTRTHRENICALAKDIQKGSLLIPTNESEIVDQSNDIPPTLGPIIFHPSERRASQRFSIIDYEHRAKREMKTIRGQFSVCFNHEMRFRKLLAPFKSLS